MGAGAPASARAGALALVAAAALATGGCRSPFDAQVDAALEAARLQAQQRDTLHAAQVLAAPPWLDAAPVGVDDAASRDPARILAERAPRWRRATDALEGSVVEDSTTDGDAAGDRMDDAADDAADDGAVDATAPVRALRLVGPPPGGSAAGGSAVDVALVGSADAAALNAVLHDGAASVQVIEAAAVGASDAPLRVEVVRETAALPTDLVVEVHARAVPRLAVLGIVVRTAAYDAVAARSGAAVVTVLEHLLEDPDATERVVVRVGSDATPQVGELGDCIALGAAALAADPSAGELGRYLVALDGAYQERDAPNGIERGGLAAEAWHLAARRELRRFCLGLASDDAPLEAPTPDA